MRKNSHSSFSHINKKTTYTDPRLAFATEEKETPDDFRQEFDSSSTALQVVHGRDLSCKVAIVTGASDGIGYETTRGLAYHGAHVILACRDVEKSKSAMERITKERVCIYHHFMIWFTDSLLPVSRKANLATL